MGAPPLRVALAVVGLGGLGVLACGLAFAPGDYGASPSPTTVDGAPESGSEGGASDASTTSGTRLLVIGGRRESLDGEASTVFVGETMRTTFDGKTLGPFVYDFAPPAAASWSRAEIGAGTLAVQTSTTVFRAAFDGGVGSEWLTLALRGTAPENNLRGWLFDGGLVAAGGFGQNGATTSVYVAPFNLGDGGIDPFQIRSSRLVKARAEVTLLRSGDFVYAVGGRDNNQATATGREEVEVAKLFPDGGIGAFVATTALTNPTAQAVHRVYAPMVAAGGGWFFVIGGSVNAQGALTDVALAARIDPATGTLGAWVALPTLPAALTTSALVVAAGHLLVFGGATASAQTDAVIASELPPPSSSSFGAWRRVGGLPASRSALVAVTY